MNPLLTSIVQWIAAHYPHIAMNFFTNGVSLLPPLQQMLVQAKVGWINVSLNAATATTWAEVCGEDKFSDVCNNLSELKRLKLQQKSVNPLVFASIVLTERNLSDLPALPGLCAELGIDRCTGFPFFAFGYGGTDKYGAEECFRPEKARYGEIYEQTLLEAQKHGISIELPIPGDLAGASSIVAPRRLHDYCRIEQNEHRLQRLLVSLLLSDVKPACFFLWQQAGIGSVNRTLGNIMESHYLYPCLGPLSGLNFAKVAAIDFGKEVDFLKMWNMPIFVLLRRAQQEGGLCSICDSCMGHDTRDPALFPTMNERLEQFLRDYDLKTTNIT